MDKFNNGSFIGDLSKSAPDRSKLKTMADVVGMPDEQDKAFIRRLILDYEKKHPGWIKKVRDNTRDFFATGGDRQKFALAGQQAGMRLMFELPTDLYSEVEKYYPTMFRDKKHFRWFLKNFKELMIPEKY